MEVRRGGFVLKEVYHGGDLTEEGDHMNRLVAGDNDGTTPSVPSETPHRSAIGTPPASAASIASLGL